MVKWKCGKNFIFAGVDNSSSVYAGARNKNILVLGKRPRQGLDNSTITAEAKYPINFTESEKRYALSVRYNGSNGFLFVNAAKIYQFQAKDLELKSYPLCLQAVSKYLKLTLVFLWNNTLWEKFNSYFSEDFLLVLKKSTFLQEDWIQGYHCIKFRRVYNIS